MLLLASIATGLVAGLIHVVSGPDHLAAIAPIAASTKQRSWLPGFMWGLGHSSGTWLLAALALVFREAIPLEAVSSWSERIVGVVLLAVGVWGFQRAIRHGLATAPTDEATTLGLGHHAHPHGHQHSHGPATGRLGRGALGIGMIHGLAGTAHLVGVLPALALPTRSAAVAYTIAFGLGSIVAMAIFAAIIGRLARHRAGAASRGLVLATSLAAIAVGLFWIGTSMQEAAAEHGTTNATAHE